MQRRFPNLQKQKVLFNVRFNMRSIWETIKDVSSMLREHKLVSSATCKFFSMDHYFEREWDHFPLFFPWFWSIWRLWRKIWSFFIVLKLQFLTISLSTNILVLFYKIEALNYFKNNAQYLKEKARTSSLQDRYLSSIDRWWTADTIFSTVLATQTVCVSQMYDGSGVLSAVSSRISAA